MPKRPSTANSDKITFISPFDAAAKPDEPPRPLGPIPASPGHPALSQWREQDSERRRSIATTSVRAPARPSARDARTSKGVQAEEAPSVPSREALFADHLSAILNHSLSLCAASNADGDSIPLAEPLSPPLTPDSSSREWAGSDEASRSPPSAGPSAPRHRIQRLPSLPSISSHDRRYLVSILQSWDFDAHSLDDDELWECANILFECVLSMEGVEPGVDASKMHSLLISLRAAYHSRNSYHNFMHATDVLQALYCFLVAFGVAPPLNTLYSEEKKWRRDAKVDAPGGLGHLLRPMDVFGLLIAAIGHDVGHPGLSNAYMVNARTPVAQVYGGKSCLENFHSITLVQMLKRQGFGHLCEPNAQGVESDFRKVLTASVLATDMSSHFPIVAKLQEAARRPSSGRGSSAEQDEEDRLLLCGCLMKCADISNPCRPHNVARAWSTCLLEEWAEQARIEAEFKLPISVITLNPAEKRAQAKSQVGFINLFTQPLYDAMAALCPEFAPFVEHCRDGRRSWEQELLEMNESRSSSPAVPSQPQRLQTSFSRAIDGQLRRSAPPQSLSSTKESPTSPDSPLSSASPSFAVSRDRRRRKASSTMASPMLDGEDADTPASSALPSGAPVTTPECDGSCANVTARCAACVRQNAPKSTTPTLAQDGFQQRSWPPSVFCPTPSVAV